MPVGKHKRAEVHSGTPIVDTEQISITVSPEAYEWLRSHEGSMSSIIKNVLEDRFGKYDVDNLTPNAAALAGIKCSECDYMGMEYEDGVCESRCYYCSSKGKPISKCADNGADTGIDLVNRNMGRRGAPSWCPKLNEEED